MCPICGKTISHAADMHEVLISRGDVRMGSESLKLHIHARENCVLVHPGPCHISAESEDGKYRCVAQLLVMEGYPRIYRWLSELCDLAGNEVQVNEAVRYLNQVATELIGFTCDAGADMWRFA